MIISLGEKLPFALCHAILLHFSEHPHPFCSTWGWTEPPCKQHFCLKLLAAHCIPRACYLHPGAKLSQTHMLLCPLGTSNILEPWLWLSKICRTDRKTKSQQTPPAFHGCLLLRGGMEEHRVLVWWLQGVCAAKGDEALLWAEGCVCSHPVNQKTRSLIMQS